jgi:copper homeostasis protein
VRLLSVKIEICANSVESAIQAAAGGAYRIELCENINEGGTTPSAGAIIRARKIPGIKLNVLIRPRAGDFLYSDIEFRTMKTDIEFCKRAEVDGVVLGILTSGGMIDKKRCDELVKLASPMSVTFHRAFDFTRLPLEALEDIIELGFRRILSSGQKNRAIEGAEFLARLVERANDRIKIMPGSGINETNIAELVNITHADEYHASLSEPVASSMTYKKDDLSLGSDNLSIMITNSERVRDLIRIANEAYNKTRNRAN